METSQKTSISIVMYGICLIIIDKELIGCFCSLVDVDEIIFEWFWSTIQISPYQPFPNAHTPSILDTFIEMYLVDDHVFEFDESFIFSPQPLRV